MAITRHPKAYSKRGVYNNIPNDANYYGVVHQVENYAKNKTILVDFNVAVSGTLILTVQDDYGWNPTPSAKIVKSWSLSAFVDTFVINDILSMCDPGALIGVAFNKPTGAGTEDIFVRFFDELV